MAIQVLEFLKYGTLGLAAIVAFLSYRYLMHHHDICVENRKAFTSVLYFSFGIVIVMVLAEAYRPTLDFYTEKRRFQERALKLQEETLEFDRKQLAGLKRMVDHREQTLRDIRTRIATACGYFSSKLTDGKREMIDCPNPEKVCDLVHGLLDDVENELKSENETTK
jgi:hypothetical protein